ILVLTGHGDTPARNELANQLQDLLGNVTFLERPFHPTTLVSVARSALRSRRRQYETRELLERRDLLTRELQHRTKNLSLCYSGYCFSQLRRRRETKDFF